MKTGRDCQSVVLRFRRSSPRQSSVEVSRPHPYAATSLDAGRSSSCVLNGQWVPRPRPARLAPPECRLQCRRLGGCVRMRGRGPFGRPECADSYVFRASVRGHPTSWESCHIGDRGSCGGKLRSGGACSPACRHKKTLRLEGH